MDVWMEGRTSALLEDCSILFLCFCDDHWAASEWTVYEMGFNSIHSYPLPCQASKKCYRNSTLRPDQKPKYLSCKRTYSTSSPAYHHLIITSHLISSHLISSHPDFSNPPLSSAHHPSFQATFFSNHSAHCSPVKLELIEFSTTPSKTTVGET